LDKFVRKTEEKLGLKELIAIGVGGMIGGGIFSVLGISVGFAGNGAPVSFLIDLLIALFAGYHYVKLALTFRDDGASYTYLRRAFPDKPWISGIEGWTVIIGYVGTLALYSFTFGAYGADLLGFPHSKVLRIFLSVFILLFFYYVNLKGVRTSGVTEDFIVYAKIFILSLFAFIGFSQLNPSRFYPPFNKGIPSVFLGAAVIFVAYEGFQLITNAVRETENPDENVPKGIYGSIVITGTIYFLLSLLAVGVLSYKQIVSAKEYALAEVAKPILGNWGRVLISFAALLATSSAINSTLFGASRMAAEMGEQRIMPAFFSKRNRKGVPAYSLTALTLFALFFTSLSGLSVIAEFSSVTFLLVSIGVSIANLELKDLTGADVKKGLTGLVLMAVTTLAIVVYLYLENRRELLSILSIYTLTAILFFSYYLFSQKGEVSRSP
jgi:amino acid transporter